MKIKWQFYDREEAARGLLEAAIEVLTRGGSLPVAMTLAQAGGQYFSDRVRAVKGRSSFSLLRQEMSELIGPDVAHDQLTELIQTAANALKHANRLEEAPIVKLSDQSVSMVILLAIADCRRVTEAISPTLERWRQAKMDEVRRLLADSPGHMALGDGLTRSLTEKVDGEDLTAG